MLKNYSQLLLGILIGLLVGLFIGRQFLPTPSAQQSQNSKQQETTNEKRETLNNTQHQIPNNADVPQKALDVLKYIKENGRAMDGYVGGRVFSNRERILPQQDDSGKPMQYQEWDVNPKTDGQNRGAERLVTSRNGRAWYTANHYRTFTEIK